MGNISSTLDKRRVIPVHAICANLNPAIPQILPALHALTGTDTTSSFFGICKSKVFKCAERLAKEDSLPRLDQKATADEATAGGTTVCGEVI